jgi:hypothetical protein
MALLWYVVLIRKDRRSFWVRRKATLQRLLSEKCKGLSSPMNSSTFSWQALRAGCRVSVIRPGSMSNPGVAVSHKKRAFPRDSVNPSRTITPLRLESPSEQHDNPWFLRFGPFDSPGSLAESEPHLRRNPQ